ncbi:hypothetical protein ACRCQJ_13230, partial [Pseudomonas aeruginosa]
GALGYLMQRQLVAEIHPPNFAHHFHTDHPVFSCSKIEQKQLNTWVSFQSAEQPLLGQFSVSGNNCPVPQDLPVPMPNPVQYLRLQSGGISELPERRAKPR